MGSKNLSHSKQHLEAISALDPVLSWPGTTTIPISGTLNPPGIHLGLFDNLTPEQKMYLETPEGREFVTRLLGQNQITFLPKWSLWEAFQQRAADKFVQGTIDFSQLVTKPQPTPPETSEKSPQEKEEPPSTPNP